MAGMPAGRLSVEIVADIARLQKDLDRAKAEVRRASQDIGTSAKEAGTNIDKMGTSFNRVGRQTGSLRAGMTQLSYQIGDVSQGFAMGVKPMTIFAQQSGQVIQAIQLMSMNSKGFIGLLAGPWGIAITSAITVLGTLGMAYLDTADDAEEATDRLAEAMERFKNSLPTVSAIGGLMTETSRKLATTSAEITQLQRQIESTNAALEVTRDDRAYAALVGRRADLMESLAAKEQEMASARNDLADAMSEEELRLRLLNEANEREAESKERGTRATRSRTAAVSAEVRAIQQQTEEANRLIERLEDEYARLSLSEEAYRAREVAKMRDIAVTDEQREAITRLNDAIDAENKLAEMADARRANIEAQQEAIRKRRDAERQAQEELYRQQEQDIRELSYLYEELFTGGIDNVWDVFRKQGLAAISDIAARWTLALISGNSITPGQAVAGAIGNPNSPLAAIFGGMFPANDNGIPTKTGGIAGTKAGGYGYFGGSPMEANATSLQSLVGNGAVGFGIGQLTASFLGGGKGGNIGASIGGAAGMAVAGPVGALVGSVLGNLVGGLFSGSQKGGVTINGGNVLSTFGKEKYQQNGLTAANDIFGTLSDIADALGGSLNTSAGLVSIGERKGSIRVDPFGLGNTKTGKGAIDFGDNLEAAIAFAIQDLLSDGILTGISQASQNLLRNGGDLEKQLEKALLIESVPKLLKERLDPLGAALDEIDEQFQDLADALREGGATAQQFADAERLYNLEREAAAEQFGQSATQLQEYLDSLAFGSNSPLSVRSQLSSARDSFSQFEQAILAGESVDVNAFTNSAQTLLGLSRQANASSSGFFADFDRIRELTQLAIDNVGDGALQDGSVVFAQQTAANTRAQAQMQEDTNALLRDIRSQLSGSNDNTTSSFINEQRAF